MKHNSHFLAAHGFPGAAMNEYSAMELSDPGRVEELFDYCQILQGVISARGWRYLLQTHGLAKLLEIDRSSGWLDADEATAADALKYQCLIAGYDPETDACGAYDETASVFIDEDGRCRTIDWGVPWRPAVDPAV
jgi:hypothetical protein